MTVEQLIEELKTMPPHKEVRVLIKEISISDEQGEFVTELPDEQAAPVDVVRHMGPFVLVRGA